MFQQNGGWRVFNNISNLTTGNNSIQNYGTGTVRYSCQWTGQNAQIAREVQMGWFGDDIRVLFID
jgi:hypothetical protein